MLTSSTFYRFHQLYQIFLRLFFILKIINELDVCASYLSFFRHVSDVVEQGVCQALFCCKPLAWIEFQHILEQVD